MNTVAFDLAAALVDHPLRHELNDEIHARPFEAIAAPSALSYLVYLNRNCNLEQELWLVGQLCAHFSCPPPAAGAIQFSCNLGPVRFRWARHGEFSAITLIRGAVTGQPFADSPRNHVPAEWLAQLPRNILLAVEVALLPEAALAAEVETLSAEYFAGNDLVGAQIAEGAGIAFTDFRIHADGCSRYLLIDKRMGPRQSGRMLQRILEIDTYRMMACLTLPLAKSLQPELAKTDSELAELTTAMPKARQEDEPALLDQLTQLAARIESALSRTDSRFSAARAYYEIVERRIRELRELRIAGTQPFSEFMARRLLPAMETCESVARSQRILAKRVGRASALLRTRVDVSREKQNQQLLASMNRRAHLQLRLQETVEGLSVAAITYYTVGLVGYAAKGLKTAGVHLEPELITGIAIPVVAVGVALGLRRMRKTLARKHQ